MNKEAAQGTGMFSGGLKMFIRRNIKNCLIIPFSDILICIGITAALGGYTLTLNLNGVIKSAVSWFSVLTFLGIWSYSGFRSGVLKRYFFLVFDFLFWTVLNLTVVFLPNAANGIEKNDSSYFFSELAKLFVQYSQTTLIGLSKLGYIVSSFSCCAVFGGMVFLGRYYRIRYEAGSLKTGLFFKLVRRELTGEPVLGNKKSEITGVEKPKVIGTFNDKISVSGEKQDKEVSRSVTDSEGGHKNFSEDSEVHSLKPLSEPRANHPVNVLKGPRNSPDKPRGKTEREAYRLNVDFFGEIESITGESDESGQNGGV